MNPAASTGRKWCRRLSALFFCQRRRMCLIAVIEFLFLVSLKAALVPEHNLLETRGQLAFFFYQPELVCGQPHNFIFTIL